MKERVAVPRENLIRRTDPVDGLRAKPYSYKAGRRGLFSNDYHIIFEGQIVGIVCKVRETDISTIVMLLNAAYGLGFGSGHTVAIDNALFDIKQQRA